jgi:RNA-directed DNA polymerase
VPRDYSKQLSRPDDELRSAFQSLRSRADLASLLGVTEPDLRYYLYRGGRRYSDFQISKRGGGVRVISAPNYSLKLLQKKLNQVLAAVYRRKPNVHGFARDRSIVSNAKVHLNKKWIVNVDLLDFFPSISYYRVRGMFMAPPYRLPKPAAAALAQLCTHENRLPQGAPTSPVVANMICARFDSDLLALAQRFRCRVTRYADDITFSTWTENFPHPLAVVENGADGKRLVKVGDELLAAIHRNGFAENPAKVRLRGRNARQEVTGLTVNEFPNVQRSYVRELRAMIHLWKKYGYEPAQQLFRNKYDRRNRRAGNEHLKLRSVIHGKLEFIRMVKGDSDQVYINLRNRLAAVDSTVTPIVQIRTEDDVMKALWVLESDRGQGTGFMLQSHGLVTCAHVIGPNMEAYQPSDPTKRYSVEVLRSDEHRDLAILEIAAHPVAVLIEAKAPIGVGQAVVVAGFPNHGPGGTGARTKTHITRIQPRHGVRHFYLANPIQSGNSGGPVLNHAFQVIGIAARGDDFRGDQAENVEPGAIAIAHVHNLPVVSSEPPKVAPTPRPPIKEELSLAQPNWLRGALERLTKMANRLRNNRRDGS